MKTLTLESLKETLEYNKDTGVFTRIKATKKCLIGKHAGRVHKKRGYREISVNNRLYYAHRLAWLYVYGSFPSNVIDHIDCKKDNNAISNLREVTVSENGQNRKGPQKNNKLRVLGVKVNGNGYSARIQVDGKQLHLGTFRTIEEATEKYQEAKSIYHITKKDKQ